jgi:hypothetical protein
MGYDGANIAINTEHITGKRTWRSSISSPHRPMAGSTSRYHSFCARVVRFSVVKALRLQQLVRCHISQFPLQRFSEFPNLISLLVPLSGCSPYYFLLPKAPLYFVLVACVSKTRNIRNNAKAPSGVLPETLKILQKIIQGVATTSPHNPCKPSWKQRCHRF